MAGRFSGIVYLTKQSSEPNREPRDRPAITPAQIEAGVEVLELYDVRCAKPWDEIAAEVFKAMLETR